MKVLILLALVLSFSLFAEERPDEGAMFGSAPKKESATRDAFKSGEVSDNPLQIGGTYYQRASISVAQGVPSNYIPLSAPLQVDGFLDARPNDRIRAFIDGRLLYDPTKDQYSNATGGITTGFGQFASTSSVPSFSTTTATPNNPQVALDSAWLKFDIERAVFLTIGKQHLKWGTGKYWNPTDFLNSQKLDPLLPYDLRLGNAMAKFDVPWEKQKMNFSGVMILDNPQAASTLGQLGGAIRVEKLFGNVEVGLETVVKAVPPMLIGADLSAPLGPFDIYGQIAYLVSAPGPVYQLNSGATPTAGADLSTLFSAATPSGSFIQVSGGLNYSFGWRENRQATLGVEYFYNQVGYSNANVYPVLIFVGQYQPFYTGQHYGAIYLTAEGPDEQKHTSYTLSTIGNFSDMSFISRLDFSWRILTYLTIQAYGDIHYGTSGGEFRFSLNTPAMTYQGANISAISIPAPIWDVGLGFRMSM